MADVKNSSAAQSSPDDPSKPLRGEYQEAPPDLGNTAEAALPEPMSKDPWANMSGGTASE